jgi:hypothetical protein
MTKRKAKPTLGQRILEALKDCAKSSDGPILERLKAVCPSYFVYHMCVVSIAAANNNVIDEQGVHAAVKVYEALNTDAINGQVGKDKEWTTRKS